VLLRLEVDSLVSLVLFCSQEQEQEPQQQQQQELQVAAKLEVLFLILQHSEQFLFQQSM
jgi:hypothetical protein